jgi:hypothetical protein
MGGRSQVSFGLRAITLAILAISVGWEGIAYCQTGQISLIIRQIPAQGGTITPSPGIHRFEPDTQIALTAAPKPGYKFVCWLGDVSNPEASSTIIQINGPKTIVALFQSTEYEAPLPKASAPGGGGSSSGAQLSTGGMAGIGNNTSLMGGAGKAASKIVASDPVFLSWPTESDSSLPEPPVVIVPVPEEQVVPEPATGTLLILGSLFVFLRRRSKRQTQ